MKLSLLVEYADKKRMPEEPMGDFFEFDSIEEFIYWNREEIDEAINLSPFPYRVEEWEKISEKLKNHEFEIRDWEEDSQFVVVSGI